MRRCFNPDDQKMEVLLYTCTFTSHRKSHYTLCFCRDSSTFSGALPLLQVKQEEKAESKLCLTSRTQEALSISHLRILGFQLSVRIDVTLCWENHLALGLFELLQQFCGARSKEHIIAREGDRQKRQKKWSQKNISEKKVSRNSEFFGNPFLLFLFNNITFFAMQLIKVQS